jgi:hypothetical protein
VLGCAQLSVCPLYASCAPRRPLSLMSTQHTSPWLPLLTALNKSWGFIPSLHCLNFFHILLRLKLVEAISP